MLLAPKRTVANDVLSTHFITVKGECPLDIAIEQMLQAFLGEVFVVSEREQLLGILTLKDISDIKKRHEDTQQAVKNFIKSEYISISGFTPLARCRDIMLKKGIGRLPVLDEDRLVGVIRSSEIRDNFYMKMEEFSLQLSNIINSLHEAVCGIDHNGRVTLWSRNAELLYGVQATEIIGQPLADYFPEAILLQVLKTKKRVDNVYHEPREGSHIAISASPIYIEEEFVGVVSSDRDITEVKTLSSQLQKATDTLEFLEREVQRISSDGFGKIIGKSPKLVKSIEVAKQVARTEASILITGESGTGKEVFARAIHANSGRNGLFVPVNCSAVPDELFESEFFGYEAGAFTSTSKKAS